MGFQKGNRRGVVSGPGYTGAAQSPPAHVAQAEAEQEARENDPQNRVKPGQEAFDAAQKELHSYGRNANVEGGVPSEILDGGYIDPTPLPKYSRDAARQMFAPDFDISSVPDRLGRTYGLNPETHVPVWSLCDNNDGAGTSFEAQHLADNPWDEPCRDRDGNKLYRNGMVLFKRPREIAEDIQARFNEISVDLRESAPNENPDIDEHSPEMKKLRETTAKAIEAYMRDSDTKLLGPENLDRAMAMFTPEETAQRKAAARYGRSAQVENQRDRTAEELKDFAAGKVGTFAMGASIVDGKVVRA